MTPIPADLTAALDSLSPLQLAWLSGYCWARADGGALPTVAATDATSAASAASAEPAPPPLAVTVLSASQTGHAREVADKLHAALAEQGINAKRISAADYKPKTIADEQVLLLVTSTQGEGEPPEEALSLHRLLFGKKAPPLPALRFAVCGLGDSSYPDFCQAGKDFDTRLAELGGERLAPRADCDVDYQATAAAWIADLVPRLAALQPAAPRTPTAAAPATPAAYDRDHPFTAPLLARQKITGRHSTKDVRHIELDLAGSGINYQAGDALGVWCENDPARVDAILAALKLDGVTVIDGKTLREQLIREREISQNTPQFVQGYAALAKSADLDAEIATHGAAPYAANTPLDAIVARYPAAITAEQLLTLLRPLTPRLYSIASAPEEVGEEVHLTVGVLHYEHDGKAYSGAASGYLGERLPEEGAARVFVEPNPNFRLPDDDNAAIIMIGNGTGIAPFRAFMQARVAREAAGKNWLVFGNPHFTEDFLYQTEWQGWQKDGFLHRYSLAWSRDQAEKVYVQDKLREEAASVWQWLQDGAYVYVCGDAARMAKDVERALLDIIAGEGGMDADAAADYLDELRQARRYQRDVY
ncbi:assimilatory sulfite reductase (NADPH) flavoprotein subunit [Cardiobacterium hominis]|uniref:assimilatory sulfite reductase (NADPH) flavoprotein subunit n=1 Tax=Cardiobacterium hominis TaxID=2718 RepID=UPI0028D736C4|nr:assimilatory sulfite reductase (NADPH) flavoprotein subunit [Cardiobacterium hominis]